MALDHEYVALLEGDVTTFLTSQGVTNEDFVAASKREIDKGDDCQNTIYELLLCIGDYRMFVLMMAAKKRMKSIPEVGTSVAPPRARALVGRDHPRRARVPEPTVYM